MLIERRKAPLPHPPELEQLKLLLKQGRMQPNRTTGKTCDRGDIRRQTVELHIETDPRVQVYIQTGSRSVKH